MKKILMITMMVVAAVALHAQLPNVQLKDVNGKTVQTGAISNDGKPVIISFWATWCKPCLRELKAIHEVYPDW
jgi:thiol-disulfide isomerase/thioredoxin